MGWEGPLTHRQFEAWRAWELDDMNVLGKNEYYLMQTACEARRVLSSKPSSIKLEHFKLTFKDKTSRPMDEASKNMLAVTKSVWITRMHSEIIYANPEPVEIGNS